MKIKSICYSYLIIITLCSSCMSFRPSANSIEIATGNQDSKTITGYVINSNEYKSEYRILKSSKKYNLVSDSSSATLEIELKGMTSIPLGCVTPQVTVSLFTLGFYPVIYTDTDTDTDTERYVFEYDEIMKSERIKIKQDVEIEKLVSWFHLFSPKKNRKRAIGKTLK